MAKHKLIIESGEPAGYKLVGRITFEGGRTTSVYGDTRERLLTAASEAVKAFHEAQRFTPETLTLDEGGAVIEALHVA